MERNGFFYPIESELILVIYTAEPCHSGFLRRAQTPNLRAGSQVLPE